MDVTEKLNSKGETNDNQSQNNPIAKEESTEDPTSNSSPKKPVVPNSDIPCYIHAVSPVKSATVGNKKYFKLILQTKDQQVRAVCFSPEKQTELKTLEKVKSPVKIQDYDNSNNDICIQKSTKIIPLESSQIDFERDEILGNGGMLPNLASIQKVAAEQVVNVKAQVVQISGTKYIDSERYGTLKKQEVILRDETSSTRFILWEEYINSLEMNKTSA